MWLCGVDFLDYFMHEQLFLKQLIRIQLSGAQTLQCHKFALCYGSKLLSCAYPQKLPASCQQVASELSQCLVYYEFEPDLM